MLQNSTDCDLLCCLAQISKQYTHYAAIALFLFFGLRTLYEVFTGEEAVCPCFFSWLHWRPCLHFVWSSPGIAAAWMSTAVTIGLAADVMWAKCREAERPHTAVSEKAQKRCQQAPTLTTRAGYVCRVPGPRATLPYRNPCMPVSELVEAGWPWQRPGPVASLLRLYPSVRVRELVQAGWPRHTLSQGRGECCLSQADPLQSWPLQEREAALGEAERQPPKAPAKTGRRRTSTATLQRNRGVSFLRAGRRVRAGRD